VETNGKEKSETSMKKLILITFTCFAVVQSGCNENHVGTGDTKLPDIRENFVFHISESRAEEANNNRGEGASDPFDINDVWMTEQDGRKYLNIEIRQIEGCSEPFPEKFDVIWDGVTIMIYPPQIPLYIKLDTSGCQELESGITETIIIDLYDHFDSKQFVDDANFLVINTSTSEDGDYEVVQSDPDN
jgi:hypothetical protein